MFGFLLGAGLAAMFFTQPAVATFGSVWPIAVLVLSVVTGLIFHRILK